VEEMKATKGIFLLILGLSLNLVCGVAGATTTTEFTQKLTLNDCLKLGLTNSLDLQIAAKNVKVAEESVRQAKAALVLSVDYSVGHIDVDTTRYNNGSVSVDLPVFTHNGLVCGLKAARLALESAREDERQTKLNLTYNIKSAFYDLWLKEQRLVVARNSAENLGQHYQTIKKYCELGKKAPFELLEAEVSWKEQKAQVTSATSNVALAKLELATLIGISQDQDLQIDYNTSLPEVPANFPLSLQMLLEDAYKQRPDLRQSGINLEIAKLNVDITKGTNKPSVTLAASQTDMAGSDLQFTLSVSGKLYDNKAKASKVRAAEEKLKIAKISDKQIHDTVRKSVQTIYQNLQVNLENANAYKANIQLSKESLRMTELSYSEGRSTIMDVKDAQLDLDEAQNNYYQTVCSYIIYLARLDFEVGN
jgi:outer membrane protein